MSIVDKYTNHRKPQKPKEVLASALEPGDTIRFPKDWAVSEFSSLIPYFSEDGLGVIPGYEIELIRKAKKK